MTRSEFALLRQINDVRTGNGLAPLRLDERLEQVARAHTRHMLDADVFAHGRAIAELVPQQAPWHHVGENLAWATGEDETPESIVDAWLASPEHRANLLATAYTRIGIGALEGPFLGNADALVVTADFAG
jgi:uncharacterized protein YkwD